MSNMSQTKFLKSLPDVVIPLLPLPLQGIKVRHPWQWIVQFHYGEPPLHYEVSRVQAGVEIAFHCESPDKDLNRYLLLGFRRHLFEIKESLGREVEAEMWSRGWTKIYKVHPEGDWSVSYQQEVADQLAQMITCLHPFFVELRQQVRQVRP